MKSKSFLKKQNLIPFCEKLSQGADLYLPVYDSRTNILDFMEWKEYAILSDEKSNDTQLEINLKNRTRKSMKSIFFPPDEKLFDFAYKKDPKDMKETKLEITDSSEDVVLQSSGKAKKIILGIKPCDMSAIKKLDSIFLKGDKPDVHYLARRKDSIFISVGCNNASNGCFCSSVGGNPFDFEDADIGIIETSEGYAIVKVDDEAEWIFKDNSSFFNEDMLSEQDEKLEQIIINAEKNLENFQAVKSINIDELPSVLDESFNSEIWQQISAKCISCAACTYVCPTCTCFNICDELKDLKGERYRSWDNCMNYYYNLEASGHNPRVEIYQRYKNKINCKFNYNYKRSSSFYCVGCGRCIDVCPSGMDIREIIDVIVKNKEKSKNK